MLCVQVVKSEHERQLEKHQGGGSSMDWDSGRKWTTSSAPKVVGGRGGQPRNHALAVELYNFNETPGY